MEINSTNRSWQVLLWPIGLLVIVLLSLGVAQFAFELRRQYVDHKPQNVISVSGEGKVKAVPDTAIVTLGVLAQGKDQKLVADDAAKRINKITEFVKSLGVKKEDITTSQSSLNPQIDWQTGKQNIVGYQSQQTVTVKVRGVDKASEIAGKIVAGAVDNGANEVYGSQFIIDDSTALQQQARLEAIEKAKQKAAELAKAAGLRLGKVISISESGSGYPPMPMYGTAEGRGGAVAMDSKVMTAPSIEPGSQEIVQTMTLTFELK